MTRTDRYLARVDEKLAALPPSRRITWLDAQIVAWHDRYALFVCTEGTSEPNCDPDDPPHAADFLLTITGLGARRKAIVTGPQP